MTSTFFTHSDQRRNSFLCNFPPIDVVMRISAYIAIPAVFLERFTEIADKNAPAAYICIGILLNALEFFNIQFYLATVLGKGS